MRPILVSRCKNETQRLPMIELIPRFGFSIKFTGKTAPVWLTQHINGV